MLNEKDIEYILSWSRKIKITTVINQQIEGTLIVWNKDVITIDIMHTTPIIISIDKIVSMQPII
jgi:hypothetical protein